MFRIIQILQGIDFAESKLEFSIPKEEKIEVVEGIMNTLNINIPKRMDKKEIIGRLIDEYEQNKSRE